MSCDKSLMALYAVTDRSWLSNETIEQQVEKALKGGVTLIQLREKHMSDDDFLAEALRVKEICKKYNVPLIINDNVEVAIKSDADGIHVGQSDMDALNVRKRLGNDKIIGVSAGTVNEALIAEKSGADYLGVGAVFSTSTKLDANNVSLSTLTEICDKINIPVVAIGGISKYNVKELSGTGIDGVAVVSAIFAEKDIESATKELKKLIKGML
ncbi:MAG: thiamine phosphate synthase [Oscillospiraceae bacterium]